MSTYNSRREFDFYEKLQKIANDQLEHDEPMNPSISNSYDSDNDEEAVEAAILGEDSEEAREEIEDINEQTPDPLDGYLLYEQKEEDEREEDEREEDEDEREKQSFDFPHLRSKIASAMLEYGALAKLIECSENPNYDDLLRKEAASLLDSALENEQSYEEIIGKVAGDLFSSNENLTELYSPSGYDFVADKLSHLVYNDTLVKLANEDQGFFGRVMDGAKSFLSGVTFLRNQEAQVQSRLMQSEQMQRDILNAGQDLEAHKNRLKNRFTTPSGVDQQAFTQALMSDPVYIQKQQQLNQMNQQFIDFEKSLIQSQSQLKRQLVGRGVIAGGLAGGAVYGGAKLYQHLNKKPQEQMLPDHENQNNGLIKKQASGKIIKENSATHNAYLKIGGMNMNYGISGEFLKLAGAAGLIEYANNPTLDYGLRKQASDTFDAISTLGESDMGIALIKVAQDLYSEQELHEFVSGHHSNFLLDKVAFFLDAGEMSTNDLVKIAGEAGAANAKGVATTLNKAVDNVKNFLGGYVDSARQNYGKTALTAGLGVALGAGAMAGYNVLKNPAEYEVGKTAAMLEQAWLAKQAAEETYLRADDFINKYSHLIG